MKLLLCMILIALAATNCVHAQAAKVATEHFEKADLSFDFPANWRLTDSSTNDVQYVTVAPTGSAAQIAVVVQAGLTASCDFPAESQQIMEGQLQRLATQIHAVTPLRTSPVKTGLGQFDVDGVQLHGQMNGQPVTADVYSLRLNRHFLSLVYRRADKDNGAPAAWNTIRQTLSLKPGVITILGGPSIDPKQPVTTGVLNGKAYRLAQPVYPAIARQAHASGTVVVQVVIDESGNVISAQAISGHPLLQAVSVAAANASKFSPTKLCDEPVRVTGVIQYNFVAQ